MFIIYSKKILLCKQEKYPNTGWLIRMIVCISVEYVPLCLTLTYKYKIIITESI